MTQRLLINLQAGWGCQLIVVVVLQVLDRHWLFSPHLQCSRRRVSSRAPWPAQRWEQPTCWAL